MPPYLPTIGLEIHAELKTRTKMFCDSLNDPSETHPNVNVCPICLGHPGTLPTINKKALIHVLKVGLALGSTIPDQSKFDRKNYFYPDLPKGYQISQYDMPLCTGGALNGIRIRRIHLEEDTGKNIHPEGADYSLVDFNRAGVPLMELVTEPDIHSAAEARAFAEELQLLLRYLGVSDADMEKGALRLEANISVSRSNDEQMKPNSPRIVLPNESYRLMGLLFEVHNKLGSVYKEKNYQDAIAEVLKREKIPYEREKLIKLKFENLEISDFFADFIIDGKILLEIKASKLISQDDIRQVLRYLKSANLPLAIIVNFRSKKLEYKRLINPEFEQDSVLFGEDSGDNLGTKVEIKNLNSFRALEEAIQYEINRQIEVLEGGAEVRQETRGWDDVKKKTYPQRSKEEAEDYRYFPEPDLPPLDLKRFDIEKIRREIPELPWDKKARLMNEYALESKAAGALVAEPDYADFFEKAVSELDAFDIPHGSEHRQNLITLLYNYLSTDLKGIIASAENPSISEIRISPEHFAHLMFFVHNGKLSSRGAKNALKYMFETGADAETAVRETGGEQISDVVDLEIIAAEVIKANPKPVGDYAKGKIEALQFLKGQVMAKSKGRANPQLTEEILKKLLTSSDSVRE